uniref:1-phosphatidylinositol 4-kinase n=1 Tax=Chlamydomonas euryale TaxID=1486919 RepID=A0A7R9V546_9CHLO
MVFYLPQLVQILRNDVGGRIAATLMSMANRSDLFAHQLIWALKTEERPPEEAFNPTVKRSGWAPPQDVGLWDISGKLRKQVESSLPPASKEYWEAEDGYFQRVTGISGVLYKYEKEERKLRCMEELEKFQVDRSDLYVPTNPDCRVVAHIPKSGTPMQSAAKVPILVAFEVVRGQAMTGRKQPQDNDDGACVAAPDAPDVSPPPPQPTSKLACIFKVGDDCRQDVLALQVVSLLKSAFVDAGLGLYLAPYGCIPTGYECGIIEVVPNCQSRAGLGELSDRGLYEIFQSQFGAVGSPSFEAARHNFVISEAGYAIASFLLQAKDRHNGNILIDDKGHLVHIDFGFILEISPGGNMGFESAAFKLSHEMTQLLDPGRTRQSAHFKMFEQLCIRGYLAARTVAEPIIATVALMADSGLPCFSRGQPIPNLRKRFNLDMSERQAAFFMRNTIADAYDKWTTGVYDVIQNMQNRIPY